ncbi:hypothetical protein VNO77_03373 [Canavalia gladiata]|uniref:Uncharacterized protein n=1 Tax=Canavalia gladiata TaxID=3824 RepID=A0AAN9RC65_CANGL
MVIPRLNKFDGLIWTLIWTSSHATDVIPGAHGEAIQEHPAPSIRNRVTSSQSFQARRMTNPNNEACNTLNLEFQHLPFLVEENSRGDMRELTCMWNWRTSSLDLEHFASTHAHDLTEFLVSFWPQRFDGCRMFFQASTERRKLRDSQSFSFFE